MVKRINPRAVSAGLVVIVATALAMARDPEPAPRSGEIALDQTTLRNLYAFIPAQCYTKTVDDGGKAHNPCHTCHVASREPNFINDGEVQLAYDFVPAARINRWKNLFVDWSLAARDISTEAITNYVRRSNYFGRRGEITLAARLKAPPRDWDVQDDGVWGGYVPDARFSFDERGFDRLEEGGYTGWRAYAYYPLPGTFWPTNGSMGDALVRLPPAFRENEAGQFELAVYRANLSIVESLILRRDVVIEATDEKRFGVDLDQDGALASARSVRFEISAAGSPRMSFVGRARLELLAGRVHLAPGLFPEGTEFLHSVRYLDAAPSGVRMAARLKELRYARKAEWWTPERLDYRAQAEAEEKADAPAEVRAIGGDMERGAFNGQGWWYQGFIEDAEGALRPQTFEETAFCVGCHGGLGKTDDGVFSFGRRLGADTYQEGWFHWTQRGLEGVPDRPIHAGSGTEYVTYLEENGAADEFRQNAEARAKFFDERGRLRADMKLRLERDISELLVPSPGRAIALDKAYRALVRTQSFRDGRDVLLGGAKQVHEFVPAGQKTELRAPIAPGWEASRFIKAAETP